jgi:hypothetical protein
LSGREHIRPTSHEPSPLGGRPDWTVTWRRDLQHIPFCDNAAGIEARLEPARDLRAIVDFYVCTIPPIDANLDEWSAPGSPFPELDELEPSHFNFKADNGFQIIVHVPSRGIHQNKKMWGASPTFQRRTCRALPKLPLSAIYVKELKGLARYAGAIIAET